MGSEENGNRNCTSVLNCPSSVMNANSTSHKETEMSVRSGSMFESTNRVDPFYGSGWDPIISDSSMVSHNEFASHHYAAVLGNQTMGSSSHPVHFPPDSVLVDVVPKIRSLGSGSLSEMVSSLGDLDRSGFHSNVAQRNIATDSLGHSQNSEGGLLGASPNGKRKRKASTGVSSKNAEVEQKDQTEENIQFHKDDYGRKNIGANSLGKQAAKQPKDNSTSAEPSKENYIHVRAKRGQATNSHSLAERVRRERISERMRLLQELVPGCSKITGKAVMLDEIINYVQSLQQQVEFLSMKLATVNPELNVDIERILSKEILHSRCSNATALGIGPGLSSSLHFPGFCQGTSNGIPHTAPPFNPLSQNSWNNELQSILLMGFDSTPSSGSLDANGFSKMEM